MKPAVTPCKMEITKKFSLRGFQNALTIGEIEGKDIAAAKFEMVGRTRNERWTISDS